MMDTKRIFTVAWIAIVAMILWSGTLLETWMTNSSAMTTGEDNLLAVFILRILYVMTLLMIHFIVGFYGWCWLPKSGDLSLRGFLINKQDNLLTILFKVGVLGVTLYNAYHIIVACIEKNQDGYIPFALTFLFIMNVWVLCVGNINRNKQRIDV